MDRSSRRFPDFVEKIIVLSTHLNLVACFRVEYPFYNDFVDVFLTLIYSVVTLLMLFFRMFSVFSSPFLNVLNIHFFVSLR